MNIRPSAGTLPLAASLLKVFGGAVVSAVKKHEDKDETVVRLYEADGAEKQITITAFADIKGAYLTDINESRNLGALAAENGNVSFTLKPYQIAMAVLKF